MSHDADRLKPSAKVVNWCKLHLGHEGNEQMRSVHRLFWNVELDDVNRFIPWTPKLHYVRSEYMGEIFAIEMRKYACFCEFCIDKDGCGLDQCEMHAYVKQWKYVPLTLKGPHPIRTWKDMHTEEAIISLDHDRVSNVIREGMWTP